MDRYTARINALGTTDRERNINRFINNVNRNIQRNPSYKNVKLNGVDTTMVIDNGTVDDNKSFKSMPRDIINLGDYIEFEGKMYLVTSLNADDEIYSHGTMFVCNTILRWQNANGDIVERYAVLSDYTKYATGFYAGNNITVGENQYGCVLPIDDETSKLKREQRFAVDSEMVELPDIYKLTNRKSNLDNYELFGRGSTLTIVLSFTEYNKETDKKVLYNDKEVWICNYKEKDEDIPTKPDIPPSAIKAEIDGNFNLKLGSYRTYTISFSENVESYDCVLDYDNSELTVDDIWIDTNFVEENKVRIRCSKNWDLVDYKIKLNVIVNKCIVGSETLTMVDLM